ncbi:MAG: hypothetical protein AB7I27_03625 [Bacteriovoracaceae bacterium]
MKTVFLSSVLMLSLLVGCGKDKSSSGGGSASSSLSYSNLSASGQQVASEFNNWYNSNTEPFQLSGNYNKVLGVYNTSSNSNTNSNCIGGWLKLCGSFSWSTSSSSSSPTSTYNQTVSVSQGSSKLSNPELAKLFNGSAGTLAYAEKVQASGSIPYAYMLTFEKNGVLTSYVIDPNYHSHQNPMSFSVAGSQQVTNVINFYRLN